MKNYSIATSYSSSLLLNNSLGLNEHSQIRCFHWLVEVEGLPKRYSSLGSFRPPQNALCHRKSSAFRLTSTLQKLHYRISQVWFGWTILCDTTSQIALSKLSKWQRKFKLRFSVYRGLIVKKNFGVSRW